MTIGSIPKYGEQMKLNKWYFGVEILKYPSTVHYQGFALRPSILILCMKVTDYGTEHLQADSRPREQKGGWKRYTFPFGIQINII